MNLEIELQKYKAVLQEVERMMSDQQMLVETLEQQQAEIDVQKGTIARLTEENERLLKSLRQCSGELKKQNEENQKLHEQNLKLLRSLKELN